MEALIKEIVGEFEKRYGGEPLVFSAPGRVNLIGEHTDYNQGFVLPFAIGSRTYAACSKRDDRHMSVYTRTLDKTAEFSLDESPAGSQKDWSLYIRGMAAMLERRGHSLPGASMVVHSDIPFGAGLSSSAALEVCTGFALCSLTSNDVDLREIAFTGQEVEHELMGVRSGLMDQLTSAFGRRGNALLIDCRNNEIEYIPVGLGPLMLVICDTQVKHELADTAYNKRRDECERGVELLDELLGGITSLRDVDVWDFEAHEGQLPQPVRKRCRHVVTENARVLAAASALKRSDLEEVGRLMYLSHDSLRDDYEVSCPELDLLVDVASTMPGVLGARMTGGGFGGCTINMIETGFYSEFQQTVAAAYRQAFDREPVISAVKPSDGARHERL